MGAAYLSQQVKHEAQQAGIKNDSLAMCAGKDAFDDPSIASDVIRSRSRGKGDSRNALKVYKCNYCSKYHIGVPAKPFVKRKTQRG